MDARLSASRDDADSDLEVEVNKFNSGIAAYDLPNTANARILWGTGRGNYLRSGSPLLLLKKLFLPFIQR